MKNALIMAAVVVASTSSHAATVVKEFTFDSGVEGWTGNYDSLSVSGGALTSTGATSADPKLFQNDDISINVGATSWDTVELRVRQVDGTGSLAWNSGGTIVVINSGALNLGGIPASTSGAWTVTSEADNWIVASASIASIGTSDITAIRVDPSTGASSNFEMDYLRVTSVPEPSSAVMLLGAAGFLAMRRRR